MKTWDPMSIFWFYTGGMPAHIALLIYIYYATSSEATPYEIEQSDDG